jgi:hypothetical protein
MHVTCVAGRHNNRDCQLDPAQPMLADAQTNMCDAGAKDKVGFKLHTAFEPLLKEFQEWNQPKK